MMHLYLLVFYFCDVTYSESCSDNYEYDVRDDIGSGGQALVIEGINRQNGEQVAMKIFDHQQDFEQEYTVLMQLMATGDKSQCFPHVYGTCEIHREPANEKVIVMERLRQDFFDVAFSVKPSFIDNVAYTKQMLECVAELHVRGFVHQDLKLENIMLTYDGKVKIVDFGTVVPIAIHPADTSDVIVGSSINAIPESVMPDEDNKLVRGVKADAWTMGLVVASMFARYRVNYYAATLVHDCLSLKATYDSDDNFLITYFMYKCIFDTGSKLSASEEKVLNRYKPDLMSCCLFRLPQHVSRETYQHCDKNHWLVQEYERHLKWIDDLWDASGVSSDERKFLRHLLNDLLKFNHIERSTVNDALNNPLFAIQCENSAEE